ncbi:MAG: hypothetical protein J1F60_10415 [Oscillospiraceae bacterium]|nr:hypothetical protein [Oscillospiraceae bacterium]
MSDKKKKKDKVIVHHGNDGHIDQQKDIVPKYTTYVITDNTTNENGCVMNKSDEDAALAKKEVDANKK